MGMGTGTNATGRTGMGTNTMGTVGDGDNWKLRGWGWGWGLGKFGVPMSFSNIYTRARAHLCL